MSMDKYRLIVVTPVYEDAEASGRLFRELAAEYPRDIYVVAVDDGSIRQPLCINDLQSANVDGVIVRLRRNVGHQRAIAVGLGYVSEYLQPHHRVVVMDSDGEDLPSTIRDLLTRLEAEEVDVVAATRASRVETIRFKVFYAVYTLLFRLLTGRAISFGNFIALTPAAVNRLVSMQELSIHVAGTVLASKLRTEMCLLNRGPRYAGRSKMNFVALTLHGFKGLMVFAEEMLVRVGAACAFSALISVGGIFAAIVLKLLGFATPGWFSVALGILILTLLQTGAVALMTLMLAGVMRGGTATTTIAYHDFIQEVIEA